MNLFTIINVENKNILYNFVQMKFIMIRFMEGKMNNVEMFNKIKSSRVKAHRAGDDEAREKLLDYLEGKMSKSFYMKGETIIEENSDSDLIYYIDRGKVLLCKSCNKKKLSGGYLMAGEFFDTSVFINEPCPFTYKAISNCSIYEIHKQDIKNIIESDDDIRKYLINMCLEMARTINIRMERLIMGGCKKNFVNFIIEHFNDSGKTDDRGNVTVTLDVNLTEIALTLNMTRETLSRIISDLKKDDIIENKRRFIIIKNLEKFVEQVE